MPLSAVIVETRPACRSINSMTRFVHSLALCRSSFPMSVKPVARSTIVTAVCQALANALDGVDLPAADDAAPLDLGRPLGDVPFTRQLAAGALSSLLPELAQMALRRPAAPHVAPDRHVDRLVADREQTVAT